MSIALIFIATAIMPITWISVMLGKRFGRPGQCGACAAWHQINRPRSCLNSWLCWSDRAEVPLDNAEVQRLDRDGAGADFGAGSTKNGLSPDAPGAGGHSTASIAVEMAPMSESPCWLSVCPSVLPGVSL